MLNGMLASPKYAVQERIKTIRYSPKPDASHLIEGKPNFFVPKHASKMNWSQQDYCFISHSPSKTQDQQIKSNGLEVKSPTGYLGYNVCHSVHAQGKSMPRYQ
jgi:hypothetical protein